MKTVFIRLGVIPAVVLLLSSAVPTLSAATIVWSGTSGVNTNWSNGTNWAGNIAPGGGDDVKFFDAGNNTVLGTPNSLVDGLFAGYIGSLQIGNTNGMHTIAIASGETLSITNGNLSDGAPADPAAAKNFTNTITGAGGTLYISNLTANISINQATAASGADRANLNLSGLDTFVVSANRMGIGDGQFPGVPVNNHVGGNLILARTNYITLAYTDTLANYLTAGKNAAIILSRNSGNNPAIISVFQLGVSNVFNVDSLNIGMDKSGNNSTPAHGVMVFNPAFAGQNPVANFYGAGGPGTRVTWWSDGDGNSSSSSSNGGGGTNDFSLGTVNAWVNVMSLARDASASADMWAGPHKGVFIFTNGTVDVNTLIIGNQAHETGTSSAACLGIMNINGAGALLRVNSTMILGNSTLNTAAGQNTAGMLNVTNGTVLANNISVGTNTTTGNNLINLVNATFVVTNSLATNVNGLATFNTANSLLGLTVPANGALVGLVKTLTGGGATNAVQLSVPVFTSYPQTIPLIQYTTLNGTFNFGLTNIPASAPGAYLTNITITPKSVALVLPTDPRPVITSQPSSYSGNPGNTVTFSVTISGASVTPLSYQWYNGATALTDGPTGDGSTNYGSQTASLTITNAQTADNGNYTVVVTNIYGSTTSTPPAVLTISSGSAPIITGPNNQTAIQGNNATFSATVSANPAATIYWQTGGTNIPGATTSTLIVTNVQYPANDQQVFYIIATNSFGTQTNSATLTVIVPPNISMQPVSLVVTNTQSASFSVTASGVPAVAYQWKKNGVSISSAANNTATNATFTIASAAPSDMSTYSCTITNLAGATNTVSVSLTVNSLMSATVLAPMNGATGVCYDTPLYITFSQAPSLVNVGKIRIYNVTNSATPVDTLDMSLNTNGAPPVVNIQPRNIGGSSFYSYPVIITGNTAAIYPHLDMLTSNQTYYVTIDEGVFADSTGAYFAGISAMNVWQFTTKPGGPANPTNLIVDASGNGDFLTVQGAVDSVPLNSTTPRFINVRNGFYTEIVNVQSKNNLDFRGQTRTGARIGYPNNNNVNQSGAPLRAMFVMNGNNCTFENITITNTTPSGGSQAEAVDVEGSQCIFYNMELDSYQDTFLVHSAGKLVYFNNCLIQGQTDFNWGYGTVYYTNCVLNCLLPGGHVTQPRSPATTNGFGFINCTITQGYSGTNTFDLGRTIGTPTSPSEVLFYNCLLADVIPGYASDAGPNMADYYCSNLTATVWRSNLVFSTHSPSNDPFVVAIQNATTWLYGWTPQVAPNILTQPANQTVSQGQTATFTVVATGISSPTYQWLKNGAPIPNATNATLNINNAVRTNSGSYSVVVSNGVGSMASSVATLTYTGNVPPVANPSTYSRAAGLPLRITIAGDLATNWSDADGDPVALSGSISSTNGAMVSYDSNFVYYNNSNNVPDQINYTVSDGQGGTGAGIIYVVVTSATAPSIANPGLDGNGHPTFSGSGIPGYVLGVEYAASLSGPWANAGTTTVNGTGSWTFTDTNQTNPGTIFYRLYYPYNPGNPPQ